jgi:hypothetical protein
VSGTHLGPVANIISLIIFRQLRICWCGRPLWQQVGSVIFSFCWASPVQPFSGLSPMGLMSIFYCLYFWDSPNLEGQVPVFISPRNRASQLYPPGQFAIYITMATINTVYTTLFIYYPSMVDVLFYYCDMFWFNPTIIRQYTYNFTKTIKSTMDALFFGCNLYIILLHLVILVFTWY